MLANRLAVVTGGASGIGKVVGSVFAKEGAKVVVADLNLEKSQQTVQSLTGKGHLAVEVDVSKHNSVKQIALQIQESFGRPVDAVVNSAGITRDGYLLKMTEENFDAVISVNLKGTFNVNQIFAKAMKEGQIKNGSIINISSIVGQTGNKGQCNYAASKAGVIGFTQSAAKELGQFNIRVNCICPGFIDTPMVETIPDHIKQMLLYQIPLGSLGQAEDIAEVCAFLASERSKYVTGASINVNGGLY